MEEITAHSEKLTVEITSPLAEELAAANQDLLADLLRRGLRDLRIEQALARYQQGGMSFGAAAELAGVTQAELARQAYVRGVEPPFDEAMLEEELH
jgi:predicted HTH domain antitoxin